MAALLSVLVVVFLALASPASAQQFVYAANAFSHDVSAYRVNIFTGAMTPVVGSPFPTGSSPTAVVVDRAVRFAYVASQSPGAVSVYGINPFTGALTPIDGSPFSVAVSPYALAIEPAGRFLFAGGGGGIATLAIDAVTGALSEVGSPYPSPADSLAVDPSGRFLYSGASGTIYGHTIDPATGELARFTVTPILSFGSLSLAMHPSGRFIYVTNLYFSFGSLRVYDVDVVSGALTLRGLPLIQVVPQAVSVDPTGRFVYVLGAAFIAGYQVDFFGNLWPIAGSPFSYFSLNATSLAIDPTGRFLVTGNYGSNSVTGLSINFFSGALTPVPGVAVPTGLSPRSVAITGISWFAFFAP
jgi:6-phosphogluconolactonase